MKRTDKEILNTVSLKVKPTSVYKQPSADFIVMMHKDDMKKIGVKENSYVLIRNEVEYNIFNWDNAGNDFEKNRLIKYINSIFNTDLKNKHSKISKTENAITISGENEHITISLDPEKRIAEISNNSIESKKLLVRTNDKGNLIITTAKWVEIRAHLIGIKHRLSMMGGKLEQGEIGVDQTYREALGLEVGGKIHVKKTKSRYGFKERLLTNLNYQKAVVRVQQNAPYMESKVPVVCICEEIMNSIGAQYGDMISIESKHMEIDVKCAKLSAFMNDFHDSIIGSTLSQNEVDEMSKKYEDTYLKNPFNLITEHRTFTGKRKEMIHPIFMDSISRNILKVKPLEPVKIRKSPSWQIKKKINAFGGLAILAIAILIPEIITITNGKPELSYIWIIMIPIIVYVIWSISTSSKYNTKIEG